MDAAAPRLPDLGISPHRPLVLVDVDEVMGLFIKGFGTFLAEEGYELRIDRFALFQNIYLPGAAEHLALGEGRKLFDTFFSTRCHQMDAAPGAVEALQRLGKRAEIIVLSNAPAEAQRLRALWLEQLGLPHPLILNSGPKGPMAAALVGQTQHRTAFVDDLIPNLDSVADHCPDTATFQLVADERLRPLAPRSDRHPRIDDWAELVVAIEASIFR